MTAFDAPALATLRRGLEHARTRDYFAAHDDWEEVWRDLNGQRRMFWQAMIQLVVGAYHYTNGNLRGCRGQWQKALQKCEDLMPSYAAPIPTPLPSLRDMLREGLAMVESGRDPLPVLGVFVTSVISEDWFTLV